MPKVRNSDQLAELPHGSGPAAEEVPCAPSKLVQSIASSREMPGPGRNGSTTTDVNVRFRGESNGWMCQATDEIEDRSIDSGKTEKKWPILSRFGQPSRVYS
jgi:hypothetical protein